MSKVFQIKQMVEHTIIIRADSEEAAHEYEEEMGDDDFHSDRLGAGHYGRA